MFGPLEVSSFTAVTPQQGAANGAGLAPIFKIGNEGPETTTTKQRRKTRGWVRVANAGSPDSRLTWPTEYTHDRRRRHRPADVAFYARIPIVSVGGQRKPTGE